MLSLCSGALPAALPQALVHPPVPSLNAAWPNTLAPWPLRGVLTQQNAPFIAAYTPLVVANSFWKTQLSNL